MQREPQQYPDGPPDIRIFNLYKTQPRSQGASRLHKKAGIKGLLMVTSTKRFRLVLPTQPPMAIHEVLLTHGLPLALLFSSRSILTGHLHIPHSVPFWGAPSPYSHRIGSWVRFFIAVGRKEVNSLSPCQLFIRHFFFPFPFLKIQWNPTQEEGLLAPHEL